MDEQEIRKRKYRRLRSNLKSIKGQLNDLQLEFDSLNSFISKSIFIENKVVDEELFSKARNTMNEVSNELSSVVLPMVNSKC